MFVYNNKQLIVQCPLRFDFFQVLEQIMTNTKLLRVNDERCSNCLKLYDRSYQTLQPPSFFNTNLAPGIKLF